jgi:hypothetical protein
MKLSMLAKQLHRFIRFGITRAEVRLGFDEECKEMKIQEAVREIEAWTKERGVLREVRDGEIGVRPFLPRCWDGNAS